MYTSQAAANIGREVTVNGIRHTILKMAEQEGKLKNGNAAPYIILGNGVDEISLHPRKALQLFTKGEVEGIKMLIEVVAAEPVEAKMTPTEVICYPTVDTNALLEAATAKLSAMLDTKETKVSKKSMCIAIFNEVVAAEGTRATCIARFMSEADLSKNGANTYYQSCRNGSYA